MTLCASGQAHALLVAPPTRGLHALLWPIGPAILDSLQREGLMPPLRIAYGSVLLAYLLFSAEENRFTRSITRLNWLNVAEGTADIPRVVLDRLKVLVPSMQMHF